MHRAPALLANTPSASTRPSQTPRPPGQLYHEEVQYGPDGAAVQCTKCLRDVVGAHYSNEEPGFPTVVLCMSCCWDEQILQAGGGDDAGSAMQLRMPAPPREGGGAGGGGDAARWPWLAPAGRLGGGSSSGGSTEGIGERDGLGLGDGSGGRRARVEQGLQQQMELQVKAAGGLLAAVASRLDSLAAAAGTSGSGGGSEGARLRFEQVLLAVVAQAQRLLR